MRGYSDSRSWVLPDNAGVVNRVLKFLLRVIAAVYLLGGCALYAFQRELLFPGRHLRPGDSPVSRVPSAAAFRVATSVGRTDAWLLPPLAGVNGQRHPALVFGHGNGEIIDMWLEGLDEFRRWGMGVMLVEYPGYGRAEGQPSEEAIREAMVGAYDILAGRPDVDPQRIVGYGQSLGGGAICALARERRLAAMILQSTFTSVRPFARRYFMPEFLVRDPFDNEEVLRAFDGRVLLLHGRHDELIPYQQAVALAQISPRNELRLYECGHYCWFPKDLPLLADMHDFLRKGGILDPPAAGSALTSVSVPNRR